MKQKIVELSAYGHGKSQNQIMWIVNGGCYLHNEECKHATPNEFKNVSV